MIIFKLLLNMTKKKRMLASAKILSSENILKTTKKTYVKQASEKLL